MCVEVGALISNSNLGSCREGVETLAEDVKYQKIK